jgi:hypothetical protein
MKVILLFMFMLLSWSSMASSQKFQRFLRTSKMKQSRISTNQLDKQVQYHTYANQSMTEDFSGEIDHQQRNVTCVLPYYQTNEFY